MPLINSSFGGRMNLDTQEYRVRSGDYIDALNVTRDSPGGGQDIVVTNLIGNETIGGFTLPSGINKCIGQKADRIRNRIYYFVWNSNDLDLIMYYDGNDGIVRPIIQNTIGTDGDILQFDPSYRINHIDLIYNDTLGDLLLWTDGNVSPRKINVDRILDGGYTTIEETFIEVAKAPPLSPPTCTYGTDTTINSNSLRKKLFMFATRFQYDDFEKTSFSTYSKIPLPIGYYGSDNDTNNTNNNFITIAVETGKANVIAIEVAMRYNIGDNWSDFVLVTSINKEQLNIPNESTYDYLFYNDNIYPPISDGVQYIPDGNGNLIQTIPLFDWVPQIAYCQALANGSNIVYGAIREGYNNYPTSQLNVTITSANVTNVPPDTDPPSITYILVANEFTFTVKGSVPVGTNYKIYIFFNGNPAIGQTFGVRLVAEYTSIMGDTVNDVASNLYNDMNSFSATPSIIASGPFGASWNVNFGSAGSYVFSIQTTPGSAGGGTISTEKTWLWDANYIFGIVYVDNENRDMPGVTTFTNPTNADNDFSVTTQSFSLSGANVQTPVIYAAINHLPPAGAVKYYWVRRRQTYADFLMYMTCDFQDDPDGDGFLFFCLANIDAYKAANSQFIYGTAPINPDSRIRVMAGIAADAYNGDIWTTNNDYEIVGTVIKTLTGGTSPDDDKTFIKVKKPAASISPAYSKNMLVMVYTPLANPTNAADSVYWEWGEAFDIYELDGVHYHRGADQDQTATQAATFSWEEGDVYFHDRSMYEGLLGSPPFTTDTVALMDANWSDFFDSAVNDNGRAQVIDVNAKQLYNPVLIRDGGSYQAGTTINEINKFLFEDFQEADRNYGDIRKLFIRDRYLYVFQKLKIGIIPVLLQIVQDTANNPLQANSLELLNKINYPYNEDIGIGDVPASFASDKYSMYGADDYRNVIWRLSQDGIIIISVLYECNSYFSIRLTNFRKSLNNGYAALGQTYTGDPTVLGVFDAFTNKYIVALEEINRYNQSGDLIFHQDAGTLTFNEISASQGAQDAGEEMEGFESFASFLPENMCALDNLLVTFKNGAPWKHTLNAPRCAYYGVQYDAYIVPVLNANSLEKKTWLGITELSDTIWECTEIKSNVNTYGSTPQYSELRTEDFRLLEGDYSAAFRRDRNSIGGMINGGTLKGNYLKVKLVKKNARDLVYLNGVSVLFKDSALTPK